MPQWVPRLKGYRSSFIAKRDAHNAHVEPTDEYTYFTSGIHLFRMVIYRAQLEAAGDYRPTSEEVESHEEIIRAAKEWLTVDSQDLRITVHLAQISYEDFTRAMRTRFAK